MGRWRYPGALLAVTAVLFGGTWLVGSVAGPPRAAGPDPAALDAVRLGPDPGAPVAAYLAGLPARLPPPGAPPVPALVQFVTERDPTAAAAALAGTDPVRAVFRVPLPRVQTALRFADLPPVDSPDPTTGTARRMDLARRAVARRASASRPGLTGRPEAVARVEAAALSGPCRCVLAVLVTGDRSALLGVAARPGVRAVDPAPPGTGVTGVALAPLLPEQTATVGPPPDDGPVPPAPAPG